MKEIGTGLNRRTLEDINDNFDEAQRLIDHANRRVGNLLTGTAQPQELVDAHLGADGTLYRTIKDRLDAEQQKTNSQLAQKANQSDISSFQTQVDNLVIGAGSDSSSYAEILQSRDIYDTLNGKQEEHLKNILMTRKDLYGDIKGRLLKGYYGPTTGNYIEGSRWYHFSVNNANNKSGELVLPPNRRVRLIEFDSSGNVLGSNFFQSGIFNVRETCTSFKINIPLAGSDPSSNDALANIDEIYQIIIRFSDGLENGVKKTSLELSDVKRELGVNKDKSEELEVETVPSIGYYGPTNGNFLEGTNWYHIFHRVENNKTSFKLIKRGLVSGTARLVQLDNNGRVVATSSFISLGESFEVSNDCVNFSLNIPLRNSNPQPSSTVFDDITGFQLYELKSRTAFAQIEQLTEKIENIGDNGTKSLKILLIGNSFSMNATQYLYDIAISAGVKNLVIGVAHDSGQGLQTIYNKTQNNGTITAYNKWSRLGYKSTPNSRILPIIQDEDWDVITFQQVSGDSGKYNTFQPHLKSLQHWVDENKTNQDVRYGLHMTWAYAKNSSMLGSSGYVDQLDMYTKIIDAYKKALKEMDFDILIPNGTSVQNARTQPDLQLVGNDLTSDGYHMEDKTGKYITSLTAFNALVASHFGKSVDDVRFVPSGSSKYLTYHAKKAAINAVLTPFKVTSQSD